MSADRRPLPSRELLSAPPVYVVDDDGQRWRVLDITRRGFLLPAPRPPRLDDWTCSRAASSSAAVTSNAVDSPDIRYLSAGILPG